MASSRSLGLLRNVPLRRQLIEPEQGLERPTQQPAGAEEHRRQLSDGADWPCRRIQWRFAAKRFRAIPSKTTDKSWRGSALQAE